MKRLIMIACICSALMQACSDSKDKDDNIKDKEVPVAVKTSFSEKYPAASEITWENAHEDDQQTYKAKFTLDGKKMKAEFDRAGQFIKDKVEDSLPVIK